MGGGFRMTSLARSLTDRSGATAMEYALLAALIAMAALAAVSQFSTILDPVWNRVGNEFTNASNKVK